MLAIGLMVTLVHSFTNANPIQPGAAKHIVLRNEFVLIKSTIFGIVCPPKPPPNDYICIVLHWTIRLAHHLCPIRGRQVFDGPPLSVPASQPPASRLDTSCNVGELASRGSYNTSIVTCTWPPPSNHHLWGYAECSVYCVLPNSH